MLQGSSELATEPVMRHNPRHWVVETVAAFRITYSGAEKEVSQPYSKAPQPYYIIRRQIPPSQKKTLATTNALIFAAGDTWKPRKWKGTHV